MKKYIAFIAIFLLGLISWSPYSNSIKSDAALKPYENNPSYWQYKGEPVLLIGGTINDNLFQIKHLKSHLDSLKAAGGNVIRNTMSDRDSGNERAFYKNKNGIYDLDRWNKTYWNNFKNLLKLCNKRDIIVQIEIWDRFDHSRTEWLTDPYNPKNNINYSYEEAGLKSLYPNHPGRNEQPFFFSVPQLNNNETLLKYQKAFVDKLLSISLQYGNVLYCIDNETNGNEMWSVFWTDHLRTEAKGKSINITEMWDDWNVSSDMHKRTIDHPDRYDFIDLSQNSQTRGNDNWVNAQSAFSNISNTPRPVNSTKIYGSDHEGGWKAQGKDTDHAVHSFFRNLVGGFASSRFHRPPHGLGLCKTTINCMKTIREVEKEVKFWNITPHMELLSRNDPEEAYIAAKEGEYYLIYFVKAGSVTLDLCREQGTYSLKWIDITNAEWMGEEDVIAGDPIDITTKTNHGCFAVLIKK